GRSLLVAGDEEADGARHGATLRLDEAGSGGGEGRDGTLHVGGTATEELVVAQLGAEGIGRPGGAVARRDDVDMSGKAEVGSFRPADAGIEVIDVRRTGRTEGEAMAGEPDCFQGALQHVEGAGIDRRDARAADEVAR